MTSLNNLPEHLKTISDKEWQKLFDLIPEIEKTETFGSLSPTEKDENGVYTFPYWEWSGIVSKFFDIVHELGIVPGFDWTEWEEGKAIGNNAKQNFMLLDEITLCKLFTLIIRADRFNDGVLIGNFENGNVLKIIKALQSKVN